MIEFVNNQEKFEITEELVVLIKSSINEAVKLIGFKEAYDITIIFTDNEGIRLINKEFRNLDTATDVLSFPLINFLKPYSSEFMLSDIDKDLDTGAFSLGDMVISIEKAAEQAIEYNHSFDREVSFLTVHSVLHLFGYDHIEENDRSLMRSLEENILESLKLSRE